MASYGLQAKCICPSGYKGLHCEGWCLNSNHNFLARFLYPCVMSCGNLNNNLPCSGVTEKCQTEVLIVEDISLSRPHVRLSIKKSIVQFIQQKNIPPQTTQKFLNSVINTFHTILV